MRIKKNITKNIDLIPFFFLLFLPFSTSELLSLIFRVSPDRDRFFSCFEKKINTCEHRINIIKQKIN
jgi:hypothetical protein